MLSTMKEDNDRRQTTLTRPWPTIIATDKGIAIVVRELTLNIFLRLFHCNVHEAVETREDAWKTRRVLVRTPGHCSCLPRYSTPEFNFTTTGCPRTLDRKSEGVRGIAVAACCLVAAVELAFG